MTVKYDKHGKKVPCALKKAKVQLTSRRKEDPYDSEEEGYSTAEDEGTFQYPRPVKKIRPNPEDGHAPKPGAPKAPGPLPQPRRKQAKPTAKSGEVVLKQKTVEDLINVVGQSAGLAVRVEEETGLKAPHTTIAGKLLLHPIMPGEKVSSFLCRYFIIMCRH